MCTHDHPTWDHRYAYGPCTLPCTCSRHTGIEAQDEDDELEDISRCPACGDVIDYCQGHGEIGDPAGAAILAQHDADDHSACHPDGCDAARERDRAAWEV